MASKAARKAIKSRTAPRSSNGERGRREGDFVEVGWNGITLEAPADWNIGAISTDTKEGYLRLDDSDMPRLEVRWQSLDSPLSVEENVDRFAAELKRKNRKARHKLKIERDTKLISRRQKRKKSLECFAWTADYQAHGAAWTCAKCDRAVLVQVLGKRDEDLGTLAARVIGSLEDHTEGGWTLWAAYDLRARMPEDFAISSQKLMTGLLELAFVRDLERMTVIRYGMANVALRHKSLLEWSKEKLAPRVHREAKFDAKEKRIKGHPGLEVIGDRTRFPHGIARFFVHCMRRSYPDQVMCRVWHCGESNKIYAVEAFIDRQNAALVDEVLERLECHC
ncbi:MAG: hypothetical protein ACE5O2_04040 [Armatimonadota bacterium]